MVPETYLLFVEFYKVLGFDVHDEHGHADLRRSLLDEVRCPVSILLIREAREIILLGVISDVWVDRFRLGQSLV